MKSNQNQTQKYIQHGTRSWLYILSFAHLPQIITYFYRYSREQHRLIAKKRAAFCVLFEILAISIGLSSKRRIRASATAIVRAGEASDIFHIFGGKKFITADFPLISDFTIVSSMVACCYLGLRQAGLRLSVSFRMQH